MELQFKRHVHVYRILYVHYNTGMILSKSKFIYLIYLVIKSGELFAVHWNEMNWIE